MKVSLKFVLSDTFLDFITGSSHKIYRRDLHEVYKK